jgi:hypothetical protein
MMPTTRDRIRKEKVPSASGQLCDGTGYNGQLDFGSPEEHSLQEDQHQTDYVPQLGIMEIAEEKRTNGCSAKAVEALVVI